MVTLTIDLLSYYAQLSFSESKKKEQIFDPCRKKWVEATWEEKVRQLWIQYLMKGLGYPVKLIAIEKMLTFNERQMRFDLLVYNSNAKAKLLLECKAPTVALSDETFFQLSRYARHFELQYLVVSNGIESYGLTYSEKENNLQWISELPDWDVFDSK